MRKSKKAEKLENLLNSIRLRAKIRKHNKLFVGCLKTDVMVNYIHDNLNPEAAEVVEQHLKKCIYCSKELKLMKRSEKALSDLTHKPKES